MVAHERSTLPNLGGGAPSSFNLLAEILAAPATSRRPGGPLSCKRDANARRRAAKCARDSATAGDNECYLQGFAAVPTASRVAFTGPSAAKRCWLQLRRAASLARPEWRHVVTPITSSARLRGAL